MLPAPLRSLSLVLLTSWPPHTTSSVTEVSITMPDNETVAQMKFTVNNNEADPERVGKASKVLTNPAVMEQIMTAIGKAIEVEDKKEAQIINNSIQNAFVKITRSSLNETQSPDVQQPQNITNTTSLR